jgi:hypothetical protein
MDKVLPKLTHSLNGYAAAFSLVDSASLTAANAAQLQVFQTEYSEFPETLELLREAMTYSEACWNAPSSEGKSEEGSK